MKHLLPYEKPEMQAICIDADVITTSFADSLPFLPTTDEELPVEIEFEEWSKEL